MKTLTFFVVVQVIILASIAGYADVRQNPDTIYQQAIAAYNKEDFVKAYDLLEKAIKVGLSGNKLDDAREKISIPIAERTSPYNIGIRAWEAGNYPKAAKFLEQALKADLNSELTKDTYLKLYYIFGILGDQQKIKYYEDKCRASFQAFEPIKSDTPLKFEIKQIVENQQNINTNEYETIVRQTTLSSGKVMSYTSVINKHGYDLTNYISDVALAKSKAYETLYVSLQLDQTGKDIFSKITRENVKKRIALMVNGKIISAPLVQEEISGGKFSITDENDLATIRLYVLMKTTRNKHSRQK